MKYVNSKGYLNTNIINITKNEVIDFDVKNKLKELDKLNIGTIKNDNKNINVEKFNEVYTTYLKGDNENV